MGAMHTSSGNRWLVWGLLAVAALANAAGYIWNLYDIVWFDEVVHAFSIFAITLAIGLMLYGVVLGGGERHELLMVLTIASIGLALGALWEIAEWGYDQMFMGNLIKGKQDTIIDLMVDTVGAIAGGIVAVTMARPRRAL